MSVKALGAGERARRFAIRTGAMARKETWHIVRDLRNVYMALGMPVVMILIFGYGVSFDLDHVPIAIVDPDRTSTSREVVRSLTENGEFDEVAAFQSSDEIERLFRQRTASAALVLPPDFEQAVARGGMVPVQLLLDGSDGTSASSVLGTAIGILRAKSVALAERSLATSAGLAGAAGRPVEARVRLLHNPELRSAVFLVPGLIAYILVIAAVLLTALTVAREWERGNMEQLFATPIGRLEIVLGKLAPYLAIGVLQALLVLTMGTVVFDVPVRGSLVVLAAGTLLFLVGTLGQGLLISVVTKNQQVATQVGAVSSLLPGVLLSGFVFPIANMPAPLRVIASNFPGRYYVELLRGVLLKGVSIDILWPQFVAMALFATLMIVLSTLRFGRRLP